MTCDNCGVCCMHMGVPMFMPEEVEALPPDVLLAYEAAKATRRLTLKVVGDFSPCAWFDLLTRRCRHHEHRPEVCRDFEVGEEDCLDQRRRAGIEGS